MTTAKETTQKVRTSRALVGVLAATALTICVAPPLIAKQAARAQTGVPGTDANSARSEQVERLALQILQTPQVKQASAEGLARYKTSEQTSKPDGARYAVSAIDNVATLAALYAAMGSVPEPTFIWTYAPPRRWHGYTVPGSRWYGDNVDTIYRGVRIDDASTYEITLRPGKTMPSQFTLMLYDFLMYETGTKERSDVPVDTIDITDKTPRNPDGSITVTVGPDPADGRTNYLRTKPGTKLIHTREIRGDGTLPPVRMAIKRTKGSAPAAKTLDELGAEATIYIAAAVEGTLNIDRVFGKLFDNQISPLRVRWITDTGSPDQKLVTDELLGPDKALGFVASGLVNIKEDEALVMTLSPMGAQYLSVNFYRPYHISPEHVNHSSSLNNVQAKANPDGTVTFIMARRDPGAFNWIDTNGIPYGSFAVRWQTLTRPVSGTLANGVKEVRVVKLADLRRELPATTRWVTPKQRAAQQAERARQFKLRCLGTPCQVGGALDRLY